MYHEMSRTFKVVGEKCSPCVCNRYKPNTVRNLGSYRFLAIFPVYKALNRLDDLLHLSADKWRWRQQSVYTPWPTMGYSTKGLSIQIGYRQKCQQNVLTGLARIGYCNDQQVFFFGKQEISRNINTENVNSMSQCFIPKQFSSIIMNKKF